MIADLPRELRAEKRGHTLTITIDRQNKLNAMTPAMGRALSSLVPAVNDDDDVRVVVLRGEGDRAFSAGSDVSALDDYGTNWQLRNRVDYARSIWEMRKPVISAIHGYCIGGGLEMALMSDIRIADRSAQFGAGEIKLGWMGGAGNTQLLPRLAPSGAALLMLLTGDLVSAEEAHRIGIVDRLTEVGQLQETVDALCERIAANAPIAAQLIKHLVRTAQSTSLEVGLSYENDLFTYAFTTADAAEGRAAFLEKRPPNFTGA